MFEQNEPRLDDLAKSFLNCAGPGRSRAEKRLPPVTRISYKGRTLRHLSTNSRRRCVRGGDHCSPPVIGPRPGWRQRPAGVGMRAKMYVITIIYERGAGVRKGCPGPSAPCFSPVINNEDGMRMLPARAAGKASGQAPGTSEKAVSPRDLTDGERAFSLRRRGGSLTSYRPHASSRGYLSRCARSAFASRTNTRPE